MIFQSKADGELGKNCHLTFMETWYLCTYVDGVFTAVQGF
jgi:hypothetical protein